MPETDLENLDISDLQNQIQDYEVPSETTDAAEGTVEFRYYIHDWNKHLGYYKTIPELQTAIDIKAVWTIGAGFEADAVTTLVLKNIKGHGKDNFNDLLMNQIRTYTIAGDSFAEIIRDSDGFLINLKPLDPGSMVIVTNKQGRIIRYEQNTKAQKKAGRFSPEKIFHLSRRRIADEIHGISVIRSVEWIIKARNEAMADWKRVLHRNVEPLWIFHLDTDDEAKIAAFKAKTDQARGQGENLYIPKGAVVPEQVTVSANSSLSPLTWINQLNDYFFQAVNAPQIIIGNAKEFTDASGKIVYLSYEQSVKSEQLYVEEQILNQLNLEINLVFPASLQQELISDNSKQSDATQQKAAVAPNDQTAELEGPK